MKLALIHHQYQCKGGMERYLFDLIEGFNGLASIDLFVYKVDRSLAVPSHVSLHHSNLNWLPRKWRKYYFANKMQQLDRSKYDLSISMMRSYHQDVVVSGGTHPGCLAHQNRQPALFDRFEISAERKSFQQSTFVMAHSNLIAEEIQQYYQIPPSKIKRLFPPINTARFNQSKRPQRLQLQQQFSINPDKTTLLFPSTGHKRKGLHELLQAMQQLPAEQYELLIAGSPSHIPDNCPHVRALGFVEDMTALYTAVDVTILPSHYEPFGLVVPESLACGTPVIISTFTGAKDIVGADEGLVIDRVTPETIIEAIKIAAVTKFPIAADYIEKQGLTIKHHIAQIAQQFTKSVTL